MLSTQYKTNSQRGEHETSAQHVIIPAMSNCKDSDPDFLPDEIVFLYFFIYYFEVTILLALLLSDYHK